MTGWVGMLGLDRQQELIVKIVDCALQGYEFWVEGGKYSERGWLRCHTGPGKTGRSRLLVEWRGYPGKSLDFPMAHYVTADQAIESIKILWPYVTWVTRENPLKEDGWEPRK